jgi:hypothetical protein
MGSFAATPLMFSCVSNNAPNASQRAAELAIFHSIGQCFDIFASFIFPSADKPLWHKGFGLNLAFNTLSAIVAVVLYSVLRRENARQDRTEYIQPSETPDIDIYTYNNLAPDFRYVP